MLSLFERILYFIIDWNIYDVIGKPISSLETEDFVIVTVLLAILVYLTLLLTKGFLKALGFLGSGVKSVTKVFVQKTVVIFDRNSEICPSCNNLLEDCECKYNKDLSTRKRYKNLKKEKKRMKKAKKIKAKALKTSRKLNK
jgi:hypothetical protein